MPDELGALLALPGVGPYTARAVLAFAFEQDVAVVDTNVARVLSRAVAGRPLRARQAQELADALVPPGGGWRAQPGTCSTSGPCTAEPEHAAAAAPFGGAAPGRETGSPSRIRR